MATPKIDFKILTKQNTLFKGGGGENINHGFRVVVRDTISWIAFLMCHKLLTWWKLWNWTQDITKLTLHVHN